MPIIIRHRLYIHVVKTLNFKNRGPRQNQVQGGVQGLTIKRKHLNREDSKLWKPWPPD